MKPWTEKVSPVLADSTMAAVFVAVGQVELHHRVDDGFQAGPLWLNLPLVLLMTAPLALRRVAPTWVLGVMLGAAVLPGIFVAHTIFFWGSLVPMAIAVYSLARHRDTLVARFAWLSGPVLLLGNMGHVAELRTPSNIFFASGLFGIAWLVGRVLHRLAVQGEALRQALESLAEEQTLREETAVTGERRRIAAEMHDVVAHAVSLMILQVGAARMKLDSEGVDVPLQLRAAEETGRQAVAELRRTLGVMRSPDEQAGLHPLPNLGSLPALAKQFEDAGMHVQLDLMQDVDDPNLAASLQLAVYRIVQEALTNVVKHAGAVPVQVAVRREEQALVVSVGNDAGRAATTSAGGHGLLGMRERVAMFGGHLDVGVTDRGGFLVLATLPLPALAEVTA